MATYSNVLNLYNLTNKATPTTSDYIPLGDAAVTGVPLKQCTVGNASAKWLYCQRGFTYHL
jgi:hypothetical protein